jgi:hypothetical protein
VVLHEISQSPRNPLLLNVLTHGQIEFFFCPIWQPRKANRTSAYINMDDSRADFVHRLPSPIHFLSTNMLSPVPPDLTSRRCALIISGTSHDLTATEAIFGLVVIPVALVFFWFSSVFTTARPGFPTPCLTGLPECELEVSGFYTLTGASPPDRGASHRPALQAKTKIRDRATSLRC